MNKMEFRKVLYYCARQVTFADVRLDKLMIKAAEHGIFLGELRCLTELDILEREGIVEIRKNIDGDGYTWVRVLEPQKLLKETAAANYKRDLAK